MDVSKPVLLEFLRLSGRIAQLYPVLVHEINACLGKGFPKSAFGRSTQEQLGESHPMPLSYLAVLRVYVLAEQIRNMVPVN